MNAKRFAKFGPRLFRAWVVAAAIYSCAAIGFSIAPIRSALERSADTTNVADNRPTLLEIGARQAAIVAAPPLLLLWFGWDLWFAVIGFLGPKPDEAEES